MHHKDIDRKKYNPNFSPQVILQSNSNKTTRHQQKLESQTQINAICHIITEKQTENWHSFLSGGPQDPQQPTLVHIKDDPY